MLRIFFVCALAITSDPMDAGPLQASAQTIVAASQSTVTPAPHEDEGHLRLVLTLPNGDELVLPDAPSDAEVPGLFGEVVDGVVSKSYLATLVPLILIALWMYSKAQALKRSHPQPPASTEPKEPPKPEQK